jgi:hypothetical protein
LGWVRLPMNARPVLEFLKDHKPDLV